MKNLDILALTKIDGEFLKAALLNNIEEQIRINVYSVDQGFNIKEKAETVLTSGPFLRDYAQELYPEANIIIAKRITTGQNLEKIMVLPKNKKVLVINYPQEVTEETIQSLKDMGLTHLEYVPYHSDNDDLGDIDTVISPGHIYLCPDWIRHKIDLGRRGLAFSTFVKILQVLELSINNLDKFGNNYISMMVNAGKKVSRLLRDAETLRKNLGVVLERIQEAIITIDEKGKIEIFNSLAEEFFNLKIRDNIGQQYEQALADYPDIVKFISMKGENCDSIYSLGEKKFLASLTEINSFDETSTICSFVEVSSLQRLEEAVRRKLHEKGYVAKYTFADIIGQSRVLYQAKTKAQKFAIHDLTVFISGESGTGKELLAQAIHNQSMRAEGPFIAINFAAIPETLVESELFGYEEGAFTGALKGGKAGLFEQAHKGTIFLDEIGDAPMTIQSSLLRVLQEGEVMRLGASKVIPVDVRIIAATNKDISTLVEEGKFRKDLYYRLKVLPINMPPLRERKQDIPLLINGFMKQLNQHKRLSPGVLEALLRYDWPGNVRELFNYLKYALALCEGNTIQIEDMPPDLLYSGNIEVADKEIKELLNTLQRTAGYREYIQILLVLRKARYDQITMGRKKLVLSLQREGFDLTEEMTRTRMKKLNYWGLIEAGSTRQGSTITLKGLKVLEHNEADY